jgi:hypothetical protein
MCNGLSSIPIESVYRNTISPKISKRVYPKVSGLSHNEIYAYNNRHSLRSKTKGYSGKTH